MRFTFLFVMMIIVACGAAAQQSNQGMISAKEAHERARSGNLLLLDIRAKEEWQETGVGENAKTLTMHQSGAIFFQQLEKLTKNDKSTPIALICATGGRSAFLRPYLNKAGYTEVLDVGEGMHGSKHGTGWLKAGLPIRPYGK